eukprot:366320-Chlamydomonas_euryale.AAC.11
MGQCSWGVCMGQWAWGGRDGAWGMRKWGWGLALTVSRDIAGTGQQARGMGQTVKQDSAEAWSIEHGLWGSTSMVSQLLA